jgi:hypothetical protein
MLASAYMGRRRRGVARFERFWSAAKTLLEKEPWRKE